MNTRNSVNGNVISDSTIGYSYQLTIDDDGETNYKNTYIVGLAGFNSSGEDNWYWLNTDEKKSRVYLGMAVQGPLTAGIPFSPNSVALTTLVNDFAVDGLRNKELKLSFSKSGSQTSISGFQQVKVSGKLRFTAK